ncbi:MAG TPA: protein kinase, partial [Candidatus Obscuribacterales bacterium]
MAKEESGRITIERACTSCGQHFGPATRICPNDGTKLVPEDKLDEGAVPDSWVTVAPDRADNRDSSGPTADPDGLQSEAVREHAAKLIGEVLNDQYELVSILGYGGMSVVYKARDNKLQKFVAVKMLLPHLMLQAQSMQRFKQEAHSASSLNHPNIVTIHNYGEAPNGQPYLVMDLLTGRSLSAIIKSEGKISVDRALHIFTQLASALSHAHQKGIIHRDLKPSNIILVELDGNKDIVKIVDFGIAKLLPQEGRDVVSLTQTGDVFGSPLYMSPEQCKGDKLDARADVYSMGCLMYEALAGQPPINGDNILEVLYRHMNEVPKDFKSLKLNPSVPQRLEAIIFKTLAKDPAMRYQTMQALLDDLTQFRNARQSSLWGKIATQFELLRLKQRPRSKSEIAIGIIATVSLILFLACAVNLVSLYTFADESPIFKDELLWKTAPEPPPADIGYIANATYERLLQQADRFLAGDNSFTFAEVLNHLQSGAQRMQAKFHWEEAARCYEKALAISSEKNGPEALPTLEIQLRLANAYFMNKNYEAAENAYRALRPFISSFILADQVSLVRTYFTCLGDSMYFQKKFSEAANTYGTYLYSLQGRGLRWTGWTRHELERY